MQNFAQDKAGKPPVEDYDVQSTYIPPEPHYDDPFAPASSSPFVINEAEATVPSPSVPSAVNTKSAPSSTVLEFHGTSPNSSLPSVLNPPSLVLCLLLLSRIRVCCTGKLFPFCSEKQTHWSFWSIPVSTNQAVALKSLVCLQTQECHRMMSMAK